MSTASSKRPLSNTREAFGQALLELADEGRNIAAVAADTAKSMYLNLMAARYPDRVFDVGIAEQNMMMVAAGIAADGSRVFATTYSIFTSMRALEQIRSFISYPGLPVTVVSGLGGFTGAVEGVTHIGLEDIGILRCIPGVTIINPSDAPSTKELVKQSADLSGPCYIRIGRDPSPTLYEPTDNVRIGKARVWFEDGDDLSLIVTGFPLDAGLQAAQRLRSEGYGVRVVELHTIRPLDEDVIEKHITQTARTVVVQEANRTGGLGDAICGLIVRRGLLPVQLEEVSVPDRFVFSGTPDELRERFGLSESALYQRLKGLLVAA